jgi:hypothetical protein
MLEYIGLTMWLFLVNFSIFKIWDSLWGLDWIGLDMCRLTPKGRRPFFGPILEFGQAIVDAIFVQKISNFWWTYGLVLASRRTNSYKIPIFGDTNMPQKHIFCVMRAVLGNQKTFYFLTFLDWIFFHKFFKKFLNISSTWKSSITHQIY